MAPLGSGRTPPPDVVVGENRCHQSYPGYTFLVKTAISIPDDVFDSAEELAHDLGMSRSQLYATAVAQFVARHQGDEVTRKLNEVYGQVEARLDPVLEELQQRAIGRGDW